MVGFDADAACEAAKSTVSGTLRSFLEFDREAFNPIYVDGDTMAFYDDEAHRPAHFDQLHSYVYLDLTEMDLFTDQLFPVAQRVESITTALDAFKLVPVYRDGGRCSSTSTTTSRWSPSSGPCGT